MNSEDDISRASVCAKQGMFDRAIQILSGAIRTDQSNRELWIQIGRIQLETQDWKAAEHSARQAIVIAPDSARAFLLLGFALRRQLRFSEAATAWKRSSELKPGPVPFVLMGEAHARVENLGEAAEAFHEALRLDPHYEEAYYNLALLCTKVESREAIAFLRKAIAIDSDYGLAYRELGVRLVGVGSLEDAEQALRKGISLLPNDSWGRCYLGNALWRMERLDEAEMQFRAATEVAPDNAGAFMALGTFLMSRERAVEAEQALQHACDLDAEDAIAHQEYARFLYLQNRIDEAKKIAARAMELDPDKGKIRRLWQKLRQH
jgi:superkiller protein 3